MKTLEIDIETFSSTDLKKAGVYKYAESPDFEILLFGYSIDGGEIRVVDLASGENLPEEVLRALKDPGVIKWAFNSQFERICLSMWLGLSHGQYLDPRSWKCSMVWSAYLGLPLSLEGVGAVLGLEKQKLTEGKDLIKYFCTPCRPTIANGQRTRNLACHDPVRWEQFKAYNARDVEVEIAIQKKLAKFPVPNSVWEEFHLDQEINDRGVTLDMTLVQNAIKADGSTRTEILERMKNLTGLENPNSVQQLKEWLKERGLETDTLGKKAVADLIKRAPKPLEEVLLLRQQLAKSSVKKYQVMENVACRDNRARGLFQFYGANRTGRWAGRLLQPQNLPRNDMPDLKEARDLVCSGNISALKLLYDSVPELLSQLIRTAFIPKNGCKFIVADFSAIEARVIAWLAKERWRNEVFATGGDIYCASASKMFKVPVVKNGVNGHLRQKGKISELALGYGGSIGALKAMGALEMGLTEEELQPLVTTWRAANLNIVRFWWDVDRAAMRAVRERTPTEIQGIRFYYQSGMLFITLPSRRRLVYVKPRIGTNRFGSDCVTYEGTGVARRWERVESYGPKFVENVVQAISRDLLSHAMKNLKHLPIVMHIHDEIVIEAPREVSTEEICQVMSETPPWAKELLLRAEGFECDFYQKD
jgi:DNA polymerase